jgi:hypothetical protein
VPTIQRISNKRRLWLSIATTVALATPLFGQSWEAGSKVTSPYTPSTFTPPNTSTDAEAKAAVSANRSDVEPAGFTPPNIRNNAAPVTPRPVTATSPTAKSSSPPVWNVAATNSKATEYVSTGERSPQEFGTGWKNFVSQKVFGAPSTTASVTLARPRVSPATPTARLEWNWQGYDTYNQRGNDSNAKVAAGNLHPDMANYMKYSHLWRSSNNGFTHPVISHTEGSQPMPLSLHKSAADSNWQGGSGRTQTAFAVNEPERSPVTPTNFATTAPSAPATLDSLPQRPNELPPPDPTPRADSMLNGIPLAVREDVAALCGDKARNLAVELTAPMRMRIAFMVRDQADAEILTEKLTRLRALAPYRVDFEVQIGQ